MVACGSKSPASPSPVQRHTAPCAPPCAQVSVVRSDVKNRLFVGGVPRDLSRDALLALLEAEAKGERPPACGAASRAEEQARWLLPRLSVLWLWRPAGPRGAHRRLRVVLLLPSLSTPTQRPARAMGDAPRRARRAGAPGAGHGPRAGAQQGLCLCRVLQLCRRRSRPPHPLPPRLQGTCMRANAVSSPRSRPLAAALTAAAAGSCAHGAKSGCRDCARRGGAVSVGDTARARLPGTCCRCTGVLSPSRGPTPSATRAAPRGRSSSSRRRSGPCTCRACRRPAASKAWTRRRWRSYLRATARCVRGLLALVFPRPALST